MKAAVGCGGNSWAEKPPRNGRDSERPRIGSRVCNSPKLLKRSSPRVKRQMFEEVLGSVREAGAILRGQRKPSRRIVISSSGVRGIRERASLSQSEFADMIGVSVKRSEERRVGKECR